MFVASLMPSKKKLPVRKQYRIPYAWHTSGTSTHHRPRTARKQRVRQARTAAARPILSHPIPSQPIPTHLDSDILGVDQVKRPPDLAESTLAEQVEQDVPSNIKSGGAGGGEQEGWLRRADSTAYNNGILPGVRSGPVGSGRGEWCGR